MKDSKAFIDFKVIWKDDDMFELQVIATNGRYSGVTRVYDTKRTLSQFAKQLEGFPTGNTTLFYECGEKDSYAYFSMKYYCIDTAGHIGVQVVLESDVATEYRPEEKDRLALEIMIEPAAIDRFQKDLYNLAMREDGQATLFGR